MLNRICVAIVGLLIMLPYCFAADRANEPLKPIPDTITLDSKKVKLGKRLFHDKQLSADDTISCASCHSLDRTGVDNDVVSLGMNQQKGAINTPTVLNSSFNFVQFWDGRSRTLEEQVEVHVHNSSVMGSGWKQVIAKLNQDPEYVAAFKESYGTSISSDAIQDAIATFEKSLITPSPFDRYLHGNDTAISENAARGYDIFKQVGCAVCHNGINVGGNMFQKFGLVKDYFTDRGNITEADFGRFNVTKNESDKFYFKVPTLRNIEFTAPYFHDGSVKSLPEAVRIMAKYQLGRELTDNQVADIVEFLKSLTGDGVKHPDRKA